MRASLQALAGKKLEPFTFKVEAVKNKELAEAIGDLKDEYLNGEKLLPTFPTVIEYWGAGYNAWFELGLDVKKTLHGEQEYEYLQQVRPGDILTVHTYIEDVYEKASLNFVIVKKEYVNQKDELVLISRTTIIEKQ